MIAGDFDDGWTNISSSVASFRTRNSRMSSAPFTCIARGTIRESRLLLVGSYSGFENYLAMLHSLIAQLGMRDVHFLGHVIERGTDGRLRRRRLVPLRERARRVLRSARRKLLQTGAGPGVRVNRGSRNDGRRRRLYATKDPLEIATVMAAVLDDADVGGSDAAIAGRGPGQAPAERLPRHAVGRGRSSPGARPTRGPGRPMGFLAAIHQSDRLEELRQFRPAVYRALPPQPGSGMRNPDSEIRNAESANAACANPEPGIRSRQTRKSIIGPRAPDPASRR